jgi:hypothetical protein
MAKKFGGNIINYLLDCNLVSVIIEDSGIGMDEVTRSSFYKKGFTSGKEGGLGLGVSEESVEFINRYGNWRVESQKGVGTKITVNIDKEKTQKAELILPEPKLFFRTKLAWGLSVLLLIIIGYALLLIFDKYSRFWVDWNPAYVKVEQGRLLYAFNSEDHKLWVHEFERNVASEESLEKEKKGFLIIEVRTSNGNAEAVVELILTQVS